MTLTKKVAIVTGAGTGIGKDFALALLKRGNFVTLCGRRHAVLEKTLSEAGDMSSNGLVVAGDVSNEADVTNIFQKTLDSFGRLDLLFNNAGIGAPSLPLDQLDYSSWKAVIDINLNGAFLCTKEAFRIMKNQEPRGGRVINNGSISSQVPRPHSAPYTASKHAITGLTKSAALDGRKYDIAVGQIDIGNATTDMASKMSLGVPQADGSIKKEATMAVDHVTDALLYMASLPPDANVLTLTVMATTMPFVGRG